MQVGTQEIVALGAGVGALAAAGRVWWPWFRGLVNADAFATQIVRLAQAGNVDRAKKLCGAAPAAPICAATLAAIEAARTAPDDRAEATAIVRERFRGAIRATVDAGAASWLVIGAALAGIALALALPDPSALPLVAPFAGFAALLLVHAYATARRLATDAVTHGDRIAEALVTSRLPPGSPA